MLVWAGQSNGTNVGDRVRYARRGTTRPLARTNSVWPVVGWGPRHMPSSVFGSIDTVVL